MRKLAERDLDAHIKSKRPLLDLLFESGALVHATPTPPPCRWPRWALRLIAALLK